MLNKYRFIIIMEGEFCKIIIYKICVYYLYESIVLTKLNKWFNLYLLFAFFI